MPRNWSVCRSKTPHPSSESTTKPSPHHSIRYSPVYACSVSVETTILFTKRNTTNLEASMEGAGTREELCGLSEESVVRAEAVVRSVAVLVFRMAFFAGISYVSLAWLVCEGYQCCLATSWFSSKLKPNVNQSCSPKVAPQQLTLRGALPPVDLRAACFVRAMLLCWK